MLVSGFGVIALLVSGLHELIALLISGFIAESSGPIKSIENLPEILGGSRNG